MSSAAGTTDVPAPPSAAALWEEGRRAMRAFETSESHEFTQSGWNFTARPVRASGTNCLACHQHDEVHRSTDPNGAVKIGDALGVVIYGYRSKR